MSHHAPRWQYVVAAWQAGWRAVEASARWWSERPLWCLAAGVLGGSWPGPEGPPASWLLGGGLLALGLTWLRPWPVPGLQRCCRLTLLGLILLASHLCWQSRPLPADHIVHHLLPRAQPMTVEGILAQPVEARGDRQYLFLQLERRQAAADQPWVPVSGLIRLNIHTTSLPFLPGDRIRVHKLRLYRVHSLGNPGGFDFQDMMERQGIYATGGVSNPCRVQGVSPASGWQLSRLVAQWREALRSRVQHWLAAPYAAVFLGMVLGQRGDIPATIQEHFRLAGTAHLLVVSGLNVSLVAMATFTALRPLLRVLRSQLPRQWLVGWRPTPLAAGLSLPVVLLYCTLVGWQVPTTRAAIMVGCYLLALLLERQRQAMDALVLAALFIVLGDPGALRDVSFQLSFVAVIAILLVSSPERLRTRQDDTATSPPSAAPDGWRRWLQFLREYVLVSTAAYLGTAPILASTFHSLPVFGIIANLLMVPLAGLLMPGGSVALVLLLAWPAAATAATSVLHPLLALLLWLTKTLATLPGGQFHLASFSALMLAGYYGVLGSLWYRQGWRRVGCWGAVLVLGTGWDYIAKYPRELHVTFLEIGTGDAIVVQAPGKHTLVIDGGGTYDGRFDPGRQVVAPFLWEHSIRRLDLMAMTHTHPNHARGLVSVMQDFPTRALLTNGSPMTADYLQELLRAAQGWGTRHTTAFRGPRQWQWGQLQLTVLSPPPTREEAATEWSLVAENNRSLVLLLQYGTVRILLTGDIEQRTERWLMAHYPDLRVDVLQVPHHGSQTSTAPAFLQHLKPRDGIISVGAGNPYGHPHARVLHTLAAQGVRVWRTDQLGAITISSDGTTYRIGAFRFPQLMPIQQEPTE